MNEAVYLVPLRNRQGAVIEWAIVSEADAERVLARRWSYDRYNGYVQARIDGKKVYLHRFVMDRTEGDGVEVDHRNQDPLDCRRENLRAGTRHDNKQNVPSYRGSSSRYRGVCWDKSKKMWQASVGRDGKRLWTKRFHDEDEAGAAAAAMRAALLPHSSENFTPPPALWEEVPA